MASCSKHCRLGKKSLLALVVAAGIGLAGLSRPAFAADITVILDQAKLVKAPDRVATLVLGNPLIADVSVQAGGILVITGKSYGITNLVALDRSGTVLMEKSVEVQAPRADVIVVYRGMERETYSCAPACNRRITPGDSSAFFEAAITQSVVRSTQSLAAGQASK